MELKVTLSEAHKSLRGRKYDFFPCFMNITTIFLYGIHDIVQQRQFHIFYCKYVSYLYCRLHYRPVRA